MIIKTFKKLVNMLTDVKNFKLVFLVACFLYTFPFTSAFMSSVIKIFLVWAVVIVLYDLIKRKELTINKKNYLLLIMIVIAGIGCLTNYKSNLVANVVNVFYMFVQTFCMTIYSNKNFNLKSLLKELKTYSYLIVILTMVCSIVSIVIYIAGFKFSVNNGYHKMLIGTFEGRLWSIYGNPNTLGHFSLFSIWNSLILLHINKILGKKQNKTILYTNIVIQWICVLLSNSRSSMLGSIISIIIYYILNTAIKSKNDEQTIVRYCLNNKLKLVRKTIVAFVCVFIISMALKYSMPLVSNLFSFIKIDGKEIGNNTINSVQRKPNSSGDTSNGRFELWKAGLKTFSEKPLFGVGIKNVNQVANKYMTERTVKIKPRLSENIHNIFLQILAGHGIFAFIVFVSYFIIKGIDYLKYLLKYKKNCESLYNLILSYVCLIISILAINLSDSNLLYFFSLFVVPIFWTSICNVDRLIKLSEKNTDKNKKDVLILIDSLAEGGAEKVLIDVTNNLNMEKYNIEVKTIYNEGVYREQLNEAICYTSVIKRPNIWKKRIVNRLIKYLPSRFIYNLFIEKRYDVEITFLEFLSTKVISGSNSSATKIAWFHTDISEKGISPFLFKNKKKIISGYQNFDKVICVSDSSKENFCNLTNLYQDTITIYNPIDKEQIVKKSNEECEYIKDKNKFTIATVGRLTEPKGYMRLCEVINKLKDEYNNIELLIIGEGTERKKLEKYIEENKLNNFIKLLGFVKNPYKYVKQADLFISSSLVEGFSLALAEAIVLDVPVLSTNTSGPLNILDNGKYGLIVDNSFEGIYSGIKQILSDKKLLLKMKHDSIERKEIFNINNTINEIEKVFDIKSPIKKQGEVFCTVFTPAYNRAYTLERLYDSLKSQTIKDFEWLVIDDGSKDNTEELFSKWLKEKNDFNINYVKVKNGGKQRAINKGLDLAKGKMFFIVDSDDYLTNDSIEKVFKFEETIKNEENFAGISGFRGYSLEKTIGLKLNKKYLDCPNNERNINNLLGDKAEVYYTDLLRRYKFPEIEGEKFVSENVVWNKIGGTGYKIRWFKDIIYICDYLNDGLTNQGMGLYKRNPKGYLLFIRNNIRYSYVSIKGRLSHYYGYYDAVKDSKSLKDIAIDLQTSTLSIKIGIFAKKLKDLFKKQESSK